MPRFDPLQNAFVAGELTPRLEGRDDIRQYAQGMRQSVNQLVLPQGAVMHRSGTQFESETKGSGPIILRPFEVGLDQAYILELGDEYMRFHANEGQLVLPFTANAVNFDGATAVGNTGPMLGLADTKKLTVSLWFNILGGDGTGMILFSQTVGPKFAIQRTAANQLIVNGSFFPTDSFTKRTSGLYSTSANLGWHNILVSADIALGRYQVYIDDAVPTFDIDTGPASSSTFDFVTATAGNDRTGVGAYPGDSINPIANQFTGDMAEVYANYDEALDLDDILNRRKFIDGAGKPVGLGLQGDNPTGSSALVYLSGDTINWHTNKGAGDGLTETGTLTNATTSPSD